MAFADYKNNAHQYITFIDSEFYPDYLDEAITIYGSVLAQFRDLVEAATSSADLLVSISQIPNPSRTQ